MGIAIPATYTNSMLTYLQNKLAIAFRTRLTEKLHADYLKGMTFYKVGNLDDRIRNADQCISRDVDRFCHATAELYSNLTKPVLDMILYNLRLASNLGSNGVVSLFVMFKVLILGCCLYIRRCASCNNSSFWKNGCRRTEIRRGIQIYSLEID